MKKQGILLVGEKGKMGLELRSLVLKSEHQAIVAGVDKEGLSAVKAKNIDVVIDFSTPEAIAEIVLWCEKETKPLVSGTTGLSQKEFQRLKALSKKVPVLWAPNMSQGIALLQSMIKCFSAARGFDFQIEEIHHRRKKDRPSGTALALQENLQKCVNAELSDPISLRGGGVFGIHRVFAFAEEEVITLEHTALNRSVFARGALQAARWIQGKKPGLYSMQDVLDF